MSCRPSALADILVIQCWVLEQRGYNRFYESWVIERISTDVFFKKPSWDRIWFELFVRAVWYNLVDFWFRSRSEIGKIWQCDDRKRYVRSLCSGLVAKRNTQLRYFVRWKKKRSYRQMMYLGWVTITMKRICGSAVYLHFARNIWDFWRKKKQG